ncbi:DODA-type extradiol aromatic ring-opening family dioxygenase [Roseibium sp.]|uniref:DODA-type extradiol aromatic ring-opening family dioxygenase n=1 Tax=Roseibium sp. TaxID=1936156 RepID=UPI003A982707
MTAALQPALPTLFLAHGSPMLALSDIPAHQFLKGLAADLPEAKAIVIMSPHWETDGLRVTSAGPLKTIHDFGRGFPRELFQIDYPAQADETLHGTVLAHLATAGLGATSDESWGLDHGAWVPLSLVFPKLKIPVLQVSLPLNSTPEDVFAIGQALSPLKEQGILLIGSGGTVHNLRQIMPEGVPAPDWVKTFDAYLDGKLADGRVAGFADMTLRSDFRQAHPTEEHLLPLFFAMGAAADATEQAPTPELLHRSYSHGTLSMSYWRFEREGT